MNPGILSEAKPLSSRELISAVYETLQQLLKGHEIDLPEGTASLVGDDSDHHRTRQGFMKYEKALLVRVGDENWAIALGVASGSYPADPYDCELAIVPVSSLSSSNSKQTAENISKTLRQGMMFENGIFFAMANGNLAGNNKSMLHQRVQNRLGSLVQENIAEDLKIIPGIFTLDLRPAVSSPVRYKPQFVPILSDIVARALT